METIHICLSADNNYAQHMGVVVASVIKNLSANYAAHFYVLDGGITNDNKQKIVQLQNIKPFEIKYIKVDTTSFGITQCNLSHLSVAAYFRLKIASLLPHLDKVLYLDSDIVVHGNVAPLWETNLADNFVGAVYDPANNSRHITELGLNPKRYFNSGVLLLNLAKMRQENCEAAFFNVIGEKAEKLRYDDQDVLNIVFKNTVHWLPPQYNVINPYTKKYDLLRKSRDAVIDLSLSPYTRQQLEQAQSHPIIVHYITASKPWFYMCRHELAHLYMRYVKLTPWANYQYPDKTFKNILKNCKYSIRQTLRFYFKRLKRLF